MSDLDRLLRALHEEPADWTLWLVLSDWLEEHGDARAEVMRLYAEMRRAPWGKVGNKLQTRMLRLLAGGVLPCLPAVTNSLGVRFVRIPPGTFQMGSPRRERGRFSDESPRHEVEITRPFYLASHQLTQQQYRAVTRTNPSAFCAGGSFAGIVGGQDTARFPVENISWDEADRFCRRLSRRAAEKSAGRQYRLPSEAEWEYACRAGVSSQPFFFRTTMREQDGNVINNGGSLGRTCAVGSYAPNALGLYDMHGNVWEWCADGWDAGYYEHSPREDPTGDPGSRDRVFRGGAWRSELRICRAACRSADGRAFADDYVGIRLALEWKRELEIDSHSP